MSRKRFNRSTFEEEGENNFFVWPFTTAGGVCLGVYKGKVQSITSLVGAACDWLADGPSTFLGTLS